MKINPNDFVETTAESGRGKNDGLTKLEHFSILIMQTKIAKFTDEGPGLRKILAQQSVQDALILVEALNEYYQMKENAIKKTTYITGPEAERVANILGAIAPDMETIINNSNKLIEEVPNDWIPKENT